jgi:hypothetical protein
MAVIELNALSTALYGSFGATVLTPENSSLEVGKLYSSLYLLHDLGGDDTDVRDLPFLQRLADEQKVFVIAPAIHHSFAMDLPWGGEYGRFVGEELPGIMRHIFPLSAKSQYIGGTGWGAYGALMQCITYPDAFAGAVLINGQFDVARLCQDSLSEVEKRITPKMLEPYFSPLTEAAESDRQIIDKALELKTWVYMGCSSTDAAEEMARMAGSVGCAVTEGKTQEELFLKAFQNL